MKEQSHIEPSLPAMEECIAAVREYKTNHNLELGYHAENCGWMASNTETSINIHISETSVELDQYNLHLIDPWFIGGIGLTQPCQLTTLDTL